MSKQDPTATHPAQPSENVSTPSSAHVRFEKWEHDRIYADAKITGKSVPFLLKRRYFTGRMPRVLLSVEDRKAIFDELHRCRDELNRIANNVDSGFLEGWHTSWRNC